jgi:hypothetical protein
MQEMVDNPKFGQIDWIVLLIFIPNENFIGYYYEKDKIMSISVKIIENTE